MNWCESLPVVAFDQVCCPPERPASAEQRQKLDNENVDENDSGAAFNAGSIRAENADLTSDPAKFAGKGDARRSVFERKRASLAEEALSKIQLDV